jgi:hypothetical protein
VTVCPECVNQNGGHRPQCRWFGAGGPIHHRGTEGRFWTETDPTVRLISIRNAGMARSVQVGDCYREGSVCSLNTREGIVWVDPEDAASCWESVSQWQERSERWIGIMAAQWRTWVKYW